MFGKAWRRSEKQKQSIDDNSSSSSTFRFTHSLWMVIWFACCCCCYIGALINEKCVLWTRNSHLAFCCCFHESHRRTLPANEALCRLILFVFSVFSVLNVGEKSENERMAKILFMIQKKGELCKVLFYCSLKNRIMMLFMSDKKKCGITAEMTETRGANFVILFSGKCLIVVSSVTSKAIEVLLEMICLNVEATSAMKTEGKYFFQYQ